MKIIPLIVVCLILIPMILSILFDWKIKFKNKELPLYWIISSVGAILCLCLGFAGSSPVRTIFFNNNSMNPLKILIIFLSCASISVLLDQIGFFSYLASIVLKKCKTSQTKLFFSFCAIIAILTIFTSNDILILTFTPFICYFTKHAKIDAIPYIVSEFVCANIWSIFFLIGNPTNIYMCTSFEITFVKYALKMAIPTICCGVFSMVLVFFLFRKSLQRPLSVENVDVARPNRTYLTVGLIGLIGTIVLMALSNYIGLELWYIPLVCSILTFVFVLVIMILKHESKTIIVNSLKNLPYALIPFLLSVSVIVATIENSGFTSLFANFLSNQNVIVVGILSFVLGNLLNNIPMTMLMTTTLASFGTNLNYIFGVVAASNICAILTPIGSLAGIMFMKILKNNEVKYDFKTFVKNGVIISIPTILVMLFLIIV